MFGVLSGQLQINVPINFRTSDLVSPPDQAQGNGMVVHFISSNYYKVFFLLLAGVDYVSVNQAFVFNSTFTDATAAVDIIDDDVLELREQFNGLLSSMSLPSNVILSPDIAIGAILEEGGNAKFV